MAKGFILFTTCNTVLKSRTWDHIMSKRFLHRKKEFLQLQPGFMAAFPKAKDLLYLIRNYIYNRYFAYWSLPWHLWLKAARYVRGHGKWNNAPFFFLGKPQHAAVDPWINDAPNFCCSYTFDRNIQVHTLIESDEPDQISTCLQIGFKTSKKNPKLISAYCDHSREDERKSQQKPTGAPISLPDWEGSRVISSTAEVCVANTTSQIRQILSWGIIYFLLRHAEGRLNWWVNRFLRTQF